jgi:hypothetical protein
VKNRAPAAVQITAEQLLLEAQSRAPNYACAWHSRCVRRCRGAPPFALLRGVTVRRASRGCACLCSGHRQASHHRS